MLKYFCGLGLSRKYITTNIYTRMKYYVRKMEDHIRDLCVRGLHVYHNIWETAPLFLPSLTVFEAACTCWFARAIAAAGT